MRYRLVSVSTMCVALMVLPGCDVTDGTPAISPVTITVTSTPPSMSLPASPSVSHSSTAAARVPYASLGAAMGRLTASIGMPVGIAVAPVAGTAVAALTVGDSDARVAWSTIKVPLAVAAERATGSSSAESAALVNSDNASAEQLWASLGSADQASAAVTAVLREGGDENTDVPTQQLRPGFTVFGQTVWSLPDAATFTAHLPCLPGTRHVVDLMGEVAANQQWGVETMTRPVATAVKGGWGPGVAGGYLVRQIGLITYRDGSGTALVMSAVGSSMTDGIAALNRVADWLDTRIGRLPRGRCRAGS